jgi:hypothetical protein
MPEPWQNPQLDAVHCHPPFVVVHPNPPAIPTPPRPLRDEPAEFLLDSLFNVISSQDVTQSELCDPRLHDVVPNHDP